jgi:SAM-dependent methyltransferase
MQAEQFDLHAKIEERHWWFVARRRIMRALVREALPPSRDSTVVDIGCGTGANIAVLADDYQCLGIDTSASAIAHARARFPHVEFVCGRAPGDLGDRAATADMFLLMDVLEHVPDDFLMLSTLLAAARPGAHFLVTVPADLSLWSQHDESFGHYRRYDLDRFQRIWRGLPVTTRLASYYNSRLFPLVKLSRAASRRRGQAGGQAGTDFWMPAAPANRALEEVFAGESRALRSSIRGGGGTAYRRGVSLIALLRREAGEIEPRSKPADLAADHYDPCADRVAAEVVAV